MASSLESLDQSICSSNSLQTRFDGLVRWQQSIHQQRNEVIQQIMTLSDPKTKWTKVSASSASSPSPESGGLFDKLKELSADQINVQRDINRVLGEQRRFDLYADGDLQKMSSSDSLLVESVDSSRMSTEPRLSTEPRMSTEPQISTEHVPVMDATRPEPTGRDHGEISMESLRRLRENSASAQEDSNDATQPTVIEPAGLPTEVLTEEDHCAVRAITNSVTKTKHQQDTQDNEMESTRRFKIKHKERDKSVSAQEDSNAVRDLFQVIVNKGWVVDDDQTDNHTPDEVCSTRCSVSAVSDYGSTSTFKDRGMKVWEREMNELLMMPIMDGDEDQTAPGSRRVSDSSMSLELSDSDEE